MAFDTLLVANRGEIAVRILRTARDMGLRTVAVFTDADAGAPHIGLADQAVRIGSGPVADSYLNGARIIEAARSSGAQAIHPGYGFLSESAEFAEAVAAAGLIFVGPSADAIRCMGDKAQAKRLMQAAGVPCVPGYDGADQSDATLLAAANRIGFPLMVKAAAGGGGRGMRRVDRQADLPAALARARAEALAGFGSEALILERALDGARHVEIQIVADVHGNTVHLGERDCSVQRRHQKVIEEAPGPGISDDLRTAMGAAALAAARAVAYCGAGTVEFLLDAEGRFHFLEMNTRLQVEHPVTELVTGLDLVSLQISVAQGQPLPVKQDDVHLRGHAIEARLYAEDPSQGFLPATGPVLHWRPARGTGIRVDAGIAQGQQIAPHFDPMLAKIIAHGPDRATALARLQRAVADTVLLGTVTNSEFLAQILATEGFRNGRVTTGFLDAKDPGAFAANPPGDSDWAIATALFLETARKKVEAGLGPAGAELRGWCSSLVPWHKLQLRCGEGQRELSACAHGTGWQVRVGDRVLLIEAEAKDRQKQVAVDGRLRTITACATQDRVYLADGTRRFDFHRIAVGRGEAGADRDGIVRAPMPGTVREIAVTEGDTVAAGAVLMVLEAMKMQHQITAPFSGVVERIAAGVGSQIASGAILLETRADEG